MMISYNVRKKTSARFKLLPGLVLLLLCISGLRAIAEPHQQWLGYRHSSDSATVVGKTPGQALEFADDKPEGLKVPEFNNSAPLFAKWKSPLAPDGFLWLAVDSSSKAGPYDLLYIDTNADGSLADEKPVRAGAPKAYGKIQSADFHDVKVCLPGDDGPIAFHLNFDLWISGTKLRRLIAGAAGWYEGDVTIGGVKNSVVIFDANANGVFNDAFLDFAKSDRIKIFRAGKLVIGRVGKYLQFGDEFYRLDVARDGAFVCLSKPQDMNIGTIDVSGEPTLLSAGGTNGLFFVPIIDGKVKLPCGKYCLNHWELERKDSKGFPWKLVATGPVPPMIFEVTDKDPKLKLELGEPLMTTASVMKRGTVYYFRDPSLIGRHGERIILTRNNAMPSAPKLHVKNSDGSFSREYSFEYG